METVGPGLTPSAIAARIRNPGFSIVKRGFDPNQVTDYLGKLADRVQALESRAQRLEAELEAARRQNGSSAHEQADSDPYEAASGRMATLMRTFDENVERLRREADEEAGRTVSGARSEADRILLDAQSRAEERRAAAEQALQDAHAEAERTLSSLTAHRETVVSELRAFHDRLIDAARALDSIEDRSGTSGAEPNGEALVPETTG